MKIKRKYMKEEEGQIEEADEEEYESEEDSESEEEPVKEISKKNVEVK